MNAVTFSVAPMFMTQHGVRWHDQWCHKASSGHIQEQANAAAHEIQTPLVSPLTEIQNKHRTAAHKTLKR